MTADQFPRCRARGLPTWEDQYGSCYITWTDLRSKLTATEYADLCQPFYGKTVAMCGPYASDVEAWLAEREKQ